MCFRHQLPGTDPGIPLHPPLHLQPHFTRPAFLSTAEQAPDPEERRESPNFPPSLLQAPSVFCPCSVMPKLSEQLTDIISLFCLLSPFILALIRDP